MSDVDYDAYVPSGVNNHSEAEGNRKTNSLVLIEHKDEKSSDIDTDVLPTGIVLTLTSAFVGIWGIMHIVSAFTDTTYVGMVYSLGVNSGDPQLYELFTSIFVHGGFAHLLINVIAFLSFGGLLSRRLNSNWKYLGYFIVSGILASLVQVLAFDVAGLSVSLPIVGASGAICATFGYFGLAKPGGKVKLFFIINMRAKNALTAFLIVSIGAVGLWGVGAGGIAHTAHATGLIIGISTAFWFGDIPDKPPVLDADYLAPAKQFYSLVPARIKNIA